MADNGGTHVLLLGNVVKVSSISETRAKREKEEKKVVGETNKYNV